MIHEGPMYLDRNAHDIPTIAFPFFLQAIKWLRNPQLAEKKTIFPGLKGLMPGSQPRMTPGTPKIHSLASLLNPYDISESKIGWLLCRFESILPRNGPRDERLGISSHIRDAQVSWSIDP